MNRVLRNILIIIFFLASPIKPQNSNLTLKRPDLKFKSYSIEDGLSQSNVSCILQDKQGFLWLGTQDGLNRFDGYNFLVFKNNINDSNSLSHNYIYDLAEDKEGNIWIATAAGGISSYNPFTNSFKKYTRDNNNLKLITVACIYIDSENQIWAGTYLIGLSKYDPETDSFISYVHDKNNPNSFPSNSIVSIFEDDKVYLWLGTDDAGLIHFNKRDGSFKNFTIKDGLVSNYVTSINRNIDGTLIIGTTEGLSILNKNGSFTNYTNNENLTGSLCSNRVKTVFVTSKGKIFIGTENSGLDYFNPFKRIFYHYRAEDLNPSAINDNSVFSIFEDVSGNIWIGTNGGLNKIKNVKKFDVFLGPDSKDPLSGKNVWTIIDDADKNLWVGTDDGLFRIDTKNNKMSKIIGDTLTNRIEHKIIYSLCEDRYRNLWIGTNSGLSYLNKKNNHISTYIDSEHGDDSYYYNIIRSIYVDKDIIWLGTFGSGVVKFDTRQKRFIPFKSSKGNFELLNKYVVFNIYKDKLGDFWFCTTFGLFQYKPESDELIHSISTFDQATQDYTKLYNQSLCLFKDNNSLWIGTSGGGLVNFVTGKGIIKRYTELEGLPNNMVYGILPDSSGNLWLSTNKGISKFNIKVGSFKNYYSSDGLPSDEFNSGASFRSSDGKIYFGSVNGVVSFYPDKIKSNEHVPQIAITDFKIFEKSFFDKINFSEDETIELSYSDNFFSFEFTALDFTSPDRNQYAYILEGFDDNWNYIGNRRFANYTNVDAGEYIFRVKGSNSDEIWNELGTSIKIIIAPPFYRTWWAYFLYGIIFITLFFSIRQYELKKRRRKEEAILKEERERAKLRETTLRAEKAELQTIALRSKKEIEKHIIRTRIASDLHDEIGSNLSSITLLSEILTRKLSRGKNKLQDLNDILQKLSEINSASKSSAEAMRDIVWFINPLSDPLNNLISRMNQTAATMLGDINYCFITDDQSLKRKIDPDIKRNIFLIFKESLGNIIKHSKANNVNISVKKTGDILNLIIEDNGIGFNIDTIKQGNGLRNLKSRAENINGNLSVNSTPGKGTIIKLTINMA